MLETPNSFVLLGIIAAIPVVGIVIALVAARLRSNRPDS